MSTASRIGIAQVTAIAGDLDANFDRARAAVDEARDLACDLLVFPELSLTGYSLAAVAHDVAMPADHERLHELSHHAAGMDLMVGFAEAGPVHIYNSVAYLSSGSVAHVQRKAYLPTYGAFEERKHFSPGQQMRAHDTRVGRMATLICNDAWQPQLAFIAIQDGAQILVAPACSALRGDSLRGDFTQYWQDLCQFHARFSQTYVVFVNRVGVEGELQFWGGSHIVAPQGDVILQAPRTIESVMAVTIDLARVREVRRSLPLLKDARLGLVAREVERLIAEGGDI